MHSRAYNILRVAFEEGVTVLVLGAWGCGVFRNDPRDVANIFHKCLVEGKFKGTFKKVVFAMGYDEEKIKVFKRFFKTKL